MKNLITIIMTIFCFAVVAQDAHYVDSLKQELSVATVDTIKLKLRYEIGEQGWILRTGYWDSIATEAGQLNMPEIEANAYNNVGFIYKRQGDISNGLTYYKKSLEIHRKLNNAKGLGNGYINIGVIYEQQGDVEKGLEYYHKAIDYYSEIEFYKGVSNALNNIAVLYSNQEEYALSIEYHLRNLEERRKIKDEKGIAESLGNIGTTYWLLKENEKAKDFLFQSLEMKVQIADETQIAIALNNLGNLFMEQKNYFKSDSLLSEAYRYASLAKNKIWMAHILNSKARLHLDQNDYVKSKTFATEALSLARELGSPDKKKDASEILYKCYKAEGQFQKSLEMHEIYLTNKDSIINEKNQKSVIRQQTKYEFEKSQLVKEQEMSELKRLDEAKIDRRNNLQYSIILVAIVAVFGLVMGLGFLTVSQKFAEGLIFFAFLIFFEFLLVLTDPFIDELTGAAPVYKLLLNAVLAGAIFPLHAFFERYLKFRLIKNRNR